MERKQLLPLLLDHVYGLRTQVEVAALSGYSVQRISQMMKILIKANGGSRANPKTVSACVYRADLRNRDWENTPAAFFKYERGLTGQEW